MEGRREWPRGTAAGVTGAGGRGRWAAEGWRWARWQPRRCHPGRPRASASFPRPLLLHVPPVHSNGTREITCPPCQPGPLPPSLSRHMAASGAFILKGNRGQPHPTPACCPAQHVSPGPCPTPQPHRAHLVLPPTLHLPHPPSTCCPGSSPEHRLSQDNAQVSRALLLPTPAQPFVTPPGERAHGKCDTAQGSHQ